MTKKGVKPTEPFKPELLVRTKDGIWARYRNYRRLVKSFRALGFDEGLISSNANSHGHFRRSDEVVGYGRNTMALLSIRWCTGESFFDEEIIHQKNSGLVRDRPKSWVSKKRHKKHAFRSQNRGCRAYRYGEARVVSEGEPPVRRWKESRPDPYDDGHDRFVARNWKDQSKSRKQWRKKYQ